ncbi:rho GTPase-activating protein 29-like [Marmota marmota marmota]|uniref:rho GTPase-activating protein 29-like n=1 Tax=Marmota marmota marmota TaxID=9994 RepID=UPI0020935478|nr:rho GTPase-activating protein 29-like [Marmota marmota marmota]
MELANVIQHINQEQDTKRDNSEDNTSPNMCMEINQILLKTKDLLRQLPPSNFNTLHYLIIHLKRVVDHSEENLMNSKKLGVIFGPCLMRPRPTTTPCTISSSLVAYANQALLVEFLITNAQMIFDGSLEPQNVSSSTDVVAPWVDKSPPSKPVISTEHSTKSQYFSTKQVSFDHYRIGINL